MLKEYVTITENKTPYDPESMIYLCKRENNSKRDFLFVNKFQGKHFPVSPSLSFSLFDLLYQEITWHEGRTLIVAFAETATAIGARIAHKAIMEGHDVYYIQTTREDMGDDYLTFSEVHSHAATQKLYLSDDVFYDAVLFVEDEITTGNTIINAVKRMGLDVPVQVASLVNWQNAEYQKNWEERGIQTTCLIKGFLKEDETIILPYSPYEYDYFSQHFHKDMEDWFSSYQCAFTHPNPRTGLTAEEFLQWVSPYTKKDVFSSKAYLIKYPRHFKENMANPSKKGISVIGTEENMYLPMLAIVSSGKDYLFHATTRSPIVVCKEDDYLLTDRIILPSFYDKTRKTYVYQVDEYQNIAFFEEVPHGTCKKYLF